MAALNTLRTKGGVVLAVVIGIALLAFLLGDLSGSSSTLFNSTNTDVGVVDGTEISVMEYSNEIDKSTLVQQISTGREVQGEKQIEYLQTQVWDKLVSKILFSESLENLGLIVSEDEKLDMINGEYISPIISSIFVNNTTGAYDRSMVSEFVSNLDLDPTGRTSIYWDFVENEISVDRSMSKYFSLVKNGLYTTNNEVDEYVNALATTSDIEFVSKSLSTIPDSLVSVTEKDLRAYYDKYKEQFKQVESRDIEYVLFESLPSESDYENAKEQVDEIASDFAKTPTIELIQFVGLNSNSPFDPIFKKSEELTPELSTFAFSDEALQGSLYGPVLNGDIYTMARLVDVKNLPDTLGAKHILIATGNDKLADSLVTVLKNDKSKFAELASLHSLDQNANLSGGDIGTFPMNAMIPEFSMPVASAKEGEIIKVETQFGIHVVEVTEIGEKFPKAQLAIVDYIVDPSNETSQAIYAKAADFANKAAEKGADFDVIISEMGASKRIARLRAGERSLQGVDGSSEIVRWVFDSKADKVSPVISIGEQNFVVRVASANAHGYVPFENAQNDFKQKVYEEKKAEYVTEQIGSNVDLADLAQQLDVEISEANDINFASFYIPRLGPAHKVIGVLSTLKEGETSQPIESMGAVSVVKVKSQSPTENLNKENEKVLLEATSENSFQQRIMSAIYLDADVIDMRIKFF